MRRHRRLVLIDRLLPLLAAFIGLVALAGAVMVQVNTSAQTARTTEELARLRLSLELLNQRAVELAGAVDNGTAEGLLALQERMDRLERQWAALPEPLSFDPAAASGQPQDDQAREIDPSWPTEDCIPIGTRFMATPGERLPICQSPAVITVSAITTDTVLLEGVGTVVENGSSPLPDTGCTVAVFSADLEGFAEMRVTCR